MIDLGDDDSSQMESMGYRQELLRRMSGFSNYAMSLSMICILAGGITSFHLGLCASGGAGVVLGWPLMTLMALAFAATMGHLASAFPNAGGLYHWASILGGRGWGWITAWFNITGLVIILSAINVGTFDFCWGFASTLTGIALPSQQRHDYQLVFVLILTLLQSLINHQGVRATTWLTDFNGYLILMVAGFLTISLFLLSPGYDWQRLWTFTNYSGIPSGKAMVWPRTDNLMLLFGLGLLLPAYTITGFDASVHAAEETVHASHAVPRGILRSVLVSGIFGWLLLIALVLAIPNLDDAVQEGGNVFFWILAHVLPQSLAIALCIGITMAQAICGLATLTSASRMVYAFARDGGMPGSRWLKQVSPVHRTPVASIWICGFFSFAFTLFTPVYSTITTVSVIFLYISYLLPTLIGMLAYGRTWTTMGPWSLGRWYLPLGCVCIIGGILVFLIGVQPPNDKALWITLSTWVILVIIWFSHSQRKFKGPPPVHDPEVNCDPLETTRRSQ